MTLPFKKNSLKSSWARVMFLLVSLWITALHSSGQKHLIVTDSINSIQIDGNSLLVIDPESAYNDTTILSPKVAWHAIHSTPVFQVIKGNIWLNFNIVNGTSNAKLYLYIPYSNITRVSLYKLNDGKLEMQNERGNGLQFNYHDRVSPNIIFETGLNSGDSSQYFLKVKSEHPLLLPIFIQKEKALVNAENLQTLIIGIYVGILIAIFFYNLFLYLSTFDKSYLIYIVFLLFLGLAQLTLSGYTFKLLWPHCPVFNRYALTSTSALAGISGIYFSMYFLHVKKYLPRLRQFLFVLIILYCAGIVSSLAGFNNVSYQILNISGLLGGLALLFASWVIAKKGYKPAYFYFVAWTAFLVGMVIFVMRNYDILPYNNFTTYVLYAGSAIEAILLSIALADKINVLRKEKDVSQAEALRASRENERLVSEQNVMLERKVAERTDELQQTNHQLTDAYKVLEDAQIQLVEAEKMASLGQLTAGIAHEINNPINFVKSNINPLKLDVNDLFEVIDEYSKLHIEEPEKVSSVLQGIDDFKKSLDMDFLKKEIYSLMKGIEDGADRTAEIVRGLRNFSRLDESQIKTVNVHEGIDSTLIILRNIIPENIRVIKNFDADGEIECFPGKLNQVFMNILNNSIQAVAKKSLREQGQIIITTRDADAGSIEISIKDTGYGMTAEVKQKVFDPFFTTKEVGEGTGLGLAIVSKIIQEHHGKIDVISEPGNGAEFLITLYRKIPMKTSL